MIILTIAGNPVSWSAHKGYGKRAFNPKSGDRHRYQWQIRPQWTRSSPISGPVKITFVYHMPVPKGIPKAKRSQMLNGKIHHIVRPDTSNLTKFAEDCLKEIVIDDDSQVVEISARKIYSESPKTVITIEVIND